MYYNSNMSKFRCYTTSWIDCDTTGSGASKWTQSAGFFRPNTTTNNVTLGSTTAGAKLFIDGDAKTRYSYTYRVMLLNQQVLPPSLKAGRIDYLEVQGDGDVAILTANVIVGNGTPRNCYFKW